MYLVGRGNVAATTSFTNNPCGVPTNAGFPLCDRGGGAFFDAKTGINASIDIFIARFDPNGVLTWSSYIGGLGNESPGFLNVDDGTINIAVDGDNRVFIFGNTMTAFPDNLTTIDTLELGGFYYQPINAGTGLSSTDTYIAAFDTGSVLVWATHFGAADGGGPSEFGHGIAIDKINKQLYVTGETVAQFFPVVCPVTSPNPYCDTAHSGLSDVYLARFNIDFALTGINESSIENTGSFLLYPNPTSGNLMLSIDLEQRGGIIVKLYSTTGRLVTARQMKADAGKLNHEMNLDGLPTGIYMVTVEMDDEVIGKKFIKL